jgi:hypothetical protein
MDPDLHIWNQEYKREEKEARNQGYYNNNGYVNVREYREANRERREQEMSQIIKQEQERRLAYQRYIEEQQRIEQERRKAIMNEIEKRIRLKQNELNNLKTKHNKGDNKSIEIRQKLKEINQIANQAKQFGLIPNTREVWKTYLPNMPKYTGPAIRTKKTSGGKKTHKRTYKIKRQTRKN